VKSAVRAANCEWRTFKWDAPLCVRAEDCVRRAHTIEHGRRLIVRAIAALSVQQVPRTSRARAAEVKQRAADGRRRQGGGSAEVQ